MRSVPLPLLTVLAWLPAPCPAQAEPVSMRPVQPVDPRRAESGFEVLEQDGLFRRVTWRVAGAPGARPIDVPLVRPVRDLELALAPEGSVLVLLAGGVRSQESLDVYLVGQGGLLHVFETQGGARLPARFNGGLGSWPLCEDEHVVLFAYQRMGRIEFRAADLRGQLHAVRSYGPEKAVQGFRAESDPVTSEVRVFFEGDPQPLVFPHPLAPRVAPDRSSIDFGVQALGVAAARPLELRNTGGRPLVVEVRVGEGPFLWLGPAVLEIAPGGSFAGEVRFLPAAAGPFRDTLWLQSNAANPRAAVVLRGEGVALSAAADPEATGQGTGRPGSGAARAAAQQPPQPMPPTRWAGLRIEPSGLQRVRISGVLLDPGAAERLRVRSSSGHREFAQLGEEGAFLVELGAAPGDTLHAAAIGRTGPASPEALLGRVLPALVAGDGQLEVRGAGASGFRLFSVVPAEEGQAADLVLQAWDGRLDARGVAAIDPLLLGDGPLWLVALVDGPDGPRRTNLLRWRR
jgi:hypothetical protein